MNKSNVSARQTARLSQQGKVNKGCAGCLSIFLFVMACGWLLEHGGCTTPEGLPKVGSEYVCTRTMSGMAMDVNLNDQVDDPLKGTSTSLGHSVRVKIISYTVDERFAFVKVLDGPHAGTYGYIAAAIMRK